MLKRGLSLVVALLVTVAAFFAYHLLLPLYISAFPRRYYDEPRLVVAIALGLTPEKWT